jgi:dethiobiotin synthetase
MLAKGPRAEGAKRRTKIYGDSVTQRTGRLALVTGTGTEIGKTHVSEALLRALGRRGLRTVGLKPIETGLSEDTRSDAERLAAASTFHVKHSVFAFSAPLSPHLAAREAGSPGIRIDAITDFVDRTCPDVDIALIELAGGLFTPLNTGEVNADLARALAPDVTILVAPDRLGVLHDVLATHRAASTLPFAFDIVVLSAPACSDPSTGRNAPELRRFLPRVLVVELPRTTVEALALDPGVAQIADRVTG